MSIRSRFAQLFTRLSASRNKQEIMTSAPQTNEDEVIQQPSTTSNEDEVIQQPSTTFVNPINQRLIDDEDPFILKSQVNIEQEESASEKEEDSKKKLSATQSFTSGKSLTLGFDKLRNQKTAGSTKEGTEPESTQSADPVSELSRDVLDIMKKPPQSRA